MSALRKARANSTFEKFRFTYRYNGADWNIEIPAASLEDAKDRVKVLTFARYESEQPTGLTRRFESEPRSRSWFVNALRSA